MQLVGPCCKAEVLADRGRAGQCGVVTPDFPELQRKGSEPASLGLYVCSSRHVNL